LPINLGLIGSEEVFNFTGLLDDYPNAAAAYSLRKLTRAYSGSAIRVRRTNLDEMDIGFDIFGNLDTAALLAFTGTGALDNGFVTKWYDQSGNGYDATQTTAINQPQIVSSGSLINVNGKPAIDFDGINDFLFNSTPLLNGQSDVLLCSVFSTTISAQQYPISFASSNTGTRGFDIRTLSSTAMRSGLLTVGTGAASTNADITFNNASGNLNLTIASFNASIGSNQHQIFANSTTIGSVTNGGQTVKNEITGVSLGTFSNLVPNSYLNGTISESFVYNSNQLSNRTGIETNINDFYSIY
jgi:hypothetical protein